MNTQKNDDLRFSALKLNVPGDFTGAIFTHGPVTDNLAGNQNLQVEN